MYVFTLDILGCSWMHSNDDTCASLMSTYPLSLRTLLPGWHVATVYHCVQVAHPNLLPYWWFFVALVCYLHLSVSLCLALIIPTSQPYA